MSKAFTHTKLRVSKFWSSVQPAFQPSQKLTGPSGFFASESPHRQGSNSATLAISFSTETMLKRGKCIPRIGHDWPNPVWLVRRLITANGCFERKILARNRLAGDGSNRGALEH